MDKIREKKNFSGITLIALVVTIVVLLILAGVSLNLVLGNNGIITKAKDSQIITRASSAEDEVELWKCDNYIAKNSKQPTVSEENMLQGLKDKRIVYEDEIDRENKMITIKKNDGTIVKEISYKDNNDCYVSEQNEYIYLMNSELNKKLIFSEAYIMYNEEPINITAIIKQSGDSTYTYIDEYNMYGYLFHSLGKTSDYYELNGKKLQVILVKDNIAYDGMINFYVGPR